MKVDLKANEVVLKATDSTQIKDNEKINGKLILTNQRIYFKSVDVKRQVFNLEILFNQIKEIIYFNTGFFTPKGIRVITCTGNELLFTMKKRDEWGKSINKMY